MSEKILHKELSYKIYGLCFKAHNDLGSFRSEKSYADYLAQLLKDSYLRFVREMALPVSFPGEYGGRNIPDFIIEDKIILDVKARRLISKSDYYQMKRYLVVSELELGLIVNFHQRYLAPKRVLN
jgi:GxxExxY protein